MLYFCQILLCSVMLKLGIFRLEAFKNRRQVSKNIINHKVNRTIDTNEDKTSHSYTLKINNAKLSVSRCIRKSSIHLKHLHRDNPSCNEAESSLF